MVWLKVPSSSSSMKRSGNRVLLVIAHPDDEVMFFTPLLSTMSKLQQTVSILCLSNGNYEGLGNIRSSELIKSASMFSISSKDVTIIDHPELQDGMQNNWPTEIIADILFKHIQSTSYNMVRMFSRIFHFIHIYCIYLSK